VNVIKNEPALISGVVQSLLALLVGLGLHLTTDQTGAILAVVAAVLGLVAAAATRPFHVAALTGVVSAVIPLLLAFGVHASTADISTVNAVIVAVFALLVRMHVSPAGRVSDPAGKVAVG
jgi:membrane-bound ClpP family serine protease